MRKIQPPHERRTVRLVVVTTPTEAAKIRVAARRLGTTLSGLFRAAGLAAACATERPTPPTDPEPAA